MPKAAETNAETAETNAETAETNAAASEANAATSESNAATSESNAATSESNASTSASTATTQAGIATTQAGNASTSASNASTSASNAATSESNAATSESNAATSESNAATSESNAATSESNAAASAAAAATAADNFDDVYLGSKTADPTLDNDGDALTEGDLYYNSVGTVLKYYTGSAWVSITSGGITDLVQDTTPQLGGMLDVNGQSIGDGTLELVKFAETASAVNEITVTNAATTNAPELSATGDDTDIDIKTNS
jgi:membrane protein involved in colicin uptake